MNKFYAAMCFLLLCCLGAQFYYFRQQPHHPKAGGMWFDGVDVRFAGPIIMSLPPVQNLDGSFVNYYETTNYYLTLSARRKETKDE